MWTNPPKKKGGGGGVKPLPPSSRQCLYFGKEWTGNPSLFQNTNMDSGLVMIINGLYHMFNISPFPIESALSNARAFVKVVSLPQEATARRFAKIKVGDGGRPLGESSGDLVGGHLGGQIAELFGGGGGEVAEVLVHPGQFEQEHRQGNQTHKCTLEFKF